MRPFPALPGRLVGSWVAFTLLATVPASARAQDPATAAGVRVYNGRVIGVYDEDTGEPIAGVEVRDMFTGLPALTTETGTVSLFFVATAGGLIGFRKLGYAPVTMPVANSLRDTIPLTVVLARVRTVLPTVVTNDSSPHYLSPALRGFGDRRRNGQGSYIGEDILRKMESETMATILSGRLRGATIRNGQLVSTRRAKGGLARFGRAPGGLTCYASVYIDNVLYYPPGDGHPVDFSRMSPDEYAGVEYYADVGMMPAWMSPTNSQCGVILLWMGER